MKKPCPQRSALQRLQMPHAKSLILAGLLLLLPHPAMARNQILDKSNFTGIDTVGVALVCQAGDSDTTYRNLTVCFGPHMATVVLHAVRKKLSLRPGLLVRYAGDGSFLNDSELLPEQKANDWFHKIATHTLMVTYTLSVPPDNAMPFETSIRMASFSVSYARQVPGPVVLEIPLDKKYSFIWPQRQEDIDKQVLAGIKFLPGLDLICPGERASCVKSPGKPANHSTSPSKTRQSRGKR